MTDEQAGPRDGEWGDGTKVCRLCGRRQAVHFAAGGAPVCDQCKQLDGAFVEAVEGMGKEKAERLLGRGLRRLFRRWW